MSLLKQLKWNLILLAVIFIALGIVLILWPGATMKTICYLLAAMLLAIGVVSLINYLRKDISGIIYRYDLVVGLCAILGGILVIVKVDKLTDLIPGAWFSGNDERYYENAEFGRYASPRTWYVARGVCDGNCKYCCRDCAFDESI